MICPTCGNRLAVLATRGVVRTRACAEGHKWTTHEVLVGLQGDRRGDAPATPLGPRQMTVLAALEGRSLNVHALMQILPGLSRSAILDNVRALRHRKLVYVAGYTPKPKPGGRHAPIYAAGSEPDAREPRTPKVERDRAYRKRQQVAHVWRI